MEIWKKNLHEVILCLIKNWEKSRQTLVSALKNKDPYVREEAAWAIGKIGDKSALDSIVPLMQDSCQSVRRYASEACLMLGWKPSNQDDMFSCLLQAHQWEKLRAMGSPAIARLQEQLSSGSKMADRELAALALDKMSCELNPDQRIVSAIAKGDFENFPTDAPGALEAALQALIDPSYSHRFDILEWLKSCADNSCVPALIEVVRMEEKNISYIDPIQKGLTTKGTKKHELF